MPKFMDRAGQERWLEGAAWRPSGLLPKREAVRRRAELMYHVRGVQGLTVADLSRMFNVTRSTVRAGLSAHARELAGRPAAEDDRDDDRPSRPRRPPGDLHRREIVRRRAMLLHRLRHGMNWSAADLAAVFNLSETAIRNGIEAASRAMAVGRSVA